MTKQEFKVAYKLITGKDFGYNTEVPCKGGIINKTYHFFETFARVDFIEGDILDFKKIFKRSIIDINYDRLLNMMEK